MKKKRNIWPVFVMCMLFLSGIALQAQVIDFEDYEIGDTLDVIGWNTGETAVIDTLPGEPGNKTLKFTPNNYNAAPVVKVILEEGKTLADYDSIKIKFFFKQGDVGWKDIIVEAYQDSPTAQAYNNSSVKVGSYNRSLGEASTDWEEIAFKLTNPSPGYLASLKDTIYLAFGINCDGTGSIGGQGVETIWYADDIEFILRTFPIPVYKWGKDRLNADTNWDLLNVPEMPRGDVIFGDTTLTNPPSGWATIAGGFDEVQATTDKAVIIRGKLELIGGGGGSAYTHMRYAVAYQDSAVLKYQNTDSAKWESPKNWFSYLFTPRTGMGTMSNTWRGVPAYAKVGVVWREPDGSWYSTNSAGTWALSQQLQAPRNAEMIAGMYDFAISVRVLPDSINEIRWYLVEENNKYWFGGVAYDSVMITTKFNQICFGFNKDSQTKLVKLYGVEVDMGDPIEVPEAPWEPFYVDLWGKDRLNADMNWAILNDSTTLVGDAIFGDTTLTNPPSNWATIAGGFGEAVEISEEKAIIVTGKLELIGGGGGSAYTHIRYGLAYQEDAKLENALTDSARWVSEGTWDTYLFTPRTGTGTMSNTWRGVPAYAKVGVVWREPDGSWYSTNSAGTWALSQVEQRPRNAEMIAGMYDFAISVKALPGGINEIRWYLVEENEKYWFAGVAYDSAQITTKFNLICFGFNKDSQTKLVKLYEVKVDKGDPIKIPLPPFVNHYLSDIGFVGGRNGNGQWTLQPGEFVGDFTLYPIVQTSAWIAIRGEFDAPIIPEAGRAVKVYGEMELIGGGFDNDNAMRLGLFNSDAGELVDYHWTGSEIGTGYLFIPPSGDNPLPYWLASGVSGSIGAVVNNVWLSTNGPDNYVLSDAVQSPAGAIGDSGKYEFELYYGKDADGNACVKIKLSKKDNSYIFEASAYDNNVVTDTINSFLFALNTTNSRVAAIKFIGLKADTTNTPEVAIGPDFANRPVEFELKQNYPNPFNPTTNIEFTLPKDTDVKIVVYDIMGRQVATLAKGYYKAGYYRITFDAGRLPSGVYFYKMVAGEFTKVKKLMLLK